MLAHKSARFFLFRWVISNLAQKFSFVTNRFDAIDLTHTSVVFAITGFKLYIIEMAK